MHRLFSAFAAVGVFPSVAGCPPTVTLPPQTLTGVPPPAVPLSGPSKAGLFTRKTRASTWADRFQCISLLSQTEDVKMPAKKPLKC